MSDQFMSIEKVCNAAKMGDLKTIENICQENKEAVICTDSIGNTPLHYSAQFGKVEVMSYLFENKADVNATNELNQTPLHIAVLRDQLDSVVSLVKQKADVHLTDKDGFTPLHLAKETQIADVLIDAGADVNSTGDNGIPVLHQYLESKKMFNFLLNKNIDINILDSNGNNALQLAHDKEQAKTLVEQGCDLNHRNKKEITPLLSAAINNNSVVVNYLLEQDSSVNDLDKNGFSVLHYFARYGDSSLVKIAVEKGADINLKGKFDMTPLHFAVLSKWEPSFWDEDVLTPSYKTTKTLIELGADINAENSEGETPLIIARQQKNEEVVKLLEKKLAD